MRILDILIRQLDKHRRASREIATLFFFFLYYWFGSALDFNSFCSSFFESHAVKDVAIVSRFATSLRGPVEGWSRGLPPRRSCEEGSPAALGRTDVRV